MQIFEFNLYRNRNRNFAAVASQSVRTLTNGYFNQARSLGNRGAWAINIEVWIHNTFITCLYSYYLT